MFLEGQSRPIPRGGAPASPKFLDLHTVGETTNKFCTVIKLDARKMFTGSITNSDMRSVCGN